MPRSLYTGISRVDLDGMRKVRDGFVMLPEKCVGDAAVVIGRAVDRESMCRALE